MKEIKRTLDVGFLKDVSGCGDNLTISLRANRTTKAGTHEGYDLELKVCRYGIRQLLLKLKEMHARDRERISREQARIQQEINALQVTP